MRYAGLLSGRGSALAIGAGRWPVDRGRASTDRTARGSRARRHPASIAGEDRESSHLPPNIFAHWFAARKVPRTPVAITDATLYSRYKLPRAPRVGHILSGGWRQRTVTGSSCASREAPSGVHVGDLGHS